MLISISSIDWNVFWIALWIIIFIAALIIEFSTEQLVSIWFASASLISFILALCSVKWWIQIIAFILLSFILIAGSRKFVKRVLQKDIPTNSDSLIGKEILVIKSVSKHDLGAGKVRDIVCPINTDEEDSINEGEYAIVTDIKGNKLDVKKKLQS